MSSPLRLHHLLPLRSQLQGRPLPRPPPSQGLRRRRLATGGPLPADSPRPRAPPPRASCTRGSAPPRPPNLGQFK
eukprot:4011911-Pyramimonas_sp.AAC.1